MESKDYWDRRYASGGDSGYGSYGEQLEKKLAWLAPLDGVKTITEVGCGDFNFGNNLIKLFPGAAYTGLDISDVVVARNKYLFPDHTFLPMGDIPPADLILCVDVLFHVLDDKQLEELLNSLEAAWTKYLVITAYERDETMVNHVRIRNFDYKRFGEPLVREIVEEDGSLYFYIFEK